MWEQRFNIMDFKTAEINTVILTADQINRYVNGVTYSNEHTEN